LARSKRGWNVASRLSLGDLQQIIEAKESEVTGLNARRAVLADELADVEAELAGAGGGKKRSRKPGKRGPGRPRKAGRRRGRVATAKKARRAKGQRRGRKAGPKGQSTLHNAIRSALNGSSEPMKLADVAANVRKSGYKTKSGDFNVIIGNRLAEMRDVKKAGRGVYAMK